MRSEDLNFIFRLQLSHCHEVRLCRLFFASPNFVQQHAALRIAHGFVSCDAYFTRDGLYDGQQLRPHRQLILPGNGGAIDLVNKSPPASGVTTTPLGCGLRCTGLSWKLIRQRRKEHKQQDKRHHDVDCMVPRS